MTAVLELVPLTLFIKYPFNKNPNLSTIKYTDIIKTKNFFMYLLPWIAFNITNALLLFIERDYFSSPEYAIIDTYGTLLVYLGVLPFSMLSGYIADKMGRKQPLVIGFTILGVSYAFIGIASNPFTWLFRTLISGISWGLIMVAYMWTILGDISSSNQKEYYYAIGLCVVSLVNGIFKFLVGVVPIVIQINVITTLFSIMLLLSVFPLMMAKETLPDDLIEEKQFKNYLERVFSMLEEDDA